MKSKEDKKTVFYQEALACVGQASGQHECRGEECSQRLQTCITDLDRAHKSKSKTLWLTTRLQPLVMGLDQYTTAFNAMVQASPSAVQVLYGGAQLVIKLVQTVNRCYDTIVDILEEIGHLLDCYRLFSTAYKNSAEMQGILVSSYKSIIRLWQKASKFLSRKAYRSLLISIVKPLDVEWQQCYATLQTDRARVQSLAQAVQAELSAAQKQKEASAQVVEWIKGGEADINLDCRSIVRENLELRHPNTGEWLFRNEIFANWISSNDSSSLFLSAPPGGGKTVLASAVVQHLQARGLQTASFFFSFNDVARSKTITAARSLALKLLTYHKSLPDHVRRLHEADSQNHCVHLADLGTAIDVFGGLLRAVPRVHIVIDGLDECHDRKNLMRMLHCLAQIRTYGIVKWLFLGRPEREIRMHLSQQGCTELSAPDSSLNDDIRTFMTDKLSDRECVHIIDDWIARSEGNFLWATLMLRIMEGEGLTCEEDVEEELMKFPKDLSGCYLRFLHYLSRYSALQQELARRIFTLVVASVQPLKLSEISHALAAATTESPHFSPRRVPSPELIEKLTSNLIVFDRSTKGCENDPLLKFAHKSIQDFFVQSAESVEAPVDLRKYFRSPEDAHLEMGRACLQYLSYSRYQQPNDVTKVILNKDHCFLQYAAAFWHIHLSQTLPSPELGKLVCDFVCTPAFWTCVAVESRVAPHLFGLYYQKREDALSMRSIGPTHLSKENKLHYASPLPIWLEYFPQGERIVGDFHAFVHQWHGVLRSDSDRLDQCPMDNEWEARWPGKAAWAPARLSCWALETQVQMTPTQTCELFGERSSDMAGGDTNAAKVSLMKSTGLEWHKCVLEDGVRRLHYSKSKLVSPNGLHRTVDIALEDDASDSFESLPNAASDTSEWHPLMGSARSSGKSNNPDTSTTAVLWMSSLPGLLNPSESSDAEDTETSEDSDGEEVDEDSGYAGSQSSTSPVRKWTLVVSQESRDPLAFSWQSGKSMDIAQCTFHPSQPWAMWSPSPHVFCRANLATGTVEKAILPEPADVDFATAFCVRKEFHVDDVTDRIYYLLYAARATDSGLQQTLSVSLLEVTETDETQMILSRAAPANTLIYSAGSSIQTPFILTFWDSKHVYVALPPLSCEPKIVRLSLTGPLTAPKAFETLCEPIFFPSSTPNRDAAMSYFSRENGESALVLILAAETSGDSEGDGHTDMQQPPVSMIWTMDDAASWRAWDASKDAQTEEYTSAESAFARLRGTYLAADQRFPVIVRSGLDWRKKAFVSCG